MMPHILIVEDERHIGTLVKFNCEAEGYRATLVGDGPTALRLLGDPGASIDLIVLDLMLPEMSGYAVLEKLRSSGCQIPVLVLTARTLSEDKIRGFDCGADQYMTKPFELPELLSRIRNLLARHAAVKGMPRQNGGAGDEVVEFGQAKVHFGRHEVTVDGEPRTLTSLELRLLKCFLEHEGLVLSRSELLDKVWGFDAMPSPRTVDNFIVRLRQHFEVDPANPRHFLSVRGTGYRFVKDPPTTDEPGE